MVTIYLLPVLTYAFLEPEIPFLLDIIFWKYAIKILLHSYGTVEIWSKNNFIRIHTFFSKKSLQIRLIIWHREISQVEYFVWMSTQIILEYKFRLLLAILIVWTNKITFDCRQITSTHRWLFDYYWENLWSDQFLSGLTSSEEHIITWTISILISFSTIRFHSHSHLYSLCQFIVSYWYRQRRANYFHHTIQ